MEIENFLFTDTDSNFKFAACRHSLSWDGISHRRSFPNTVILAHVDTCHGTIEGSALEMNGRNTRKGDLSLNNNVFIWCKEDDKMIKRFPEKGK